MLQEGMFSLWNTGAASSRFWDTSRATRLAFSAEAFVVCTLIDLFLHMVAVLMSAQLPACIGSADFLVLCNSRVHILSFLFLISLVAQAARVLVRDVLGHY